MDTSLLQRMKESIAYEFSRTGPPDGFPSFHDIPAGRYTSDEFWELEQEHLWPKSWVLACRADDVSEPGSYLRFEDLGVPLLIVRGQDLEIRGFYNTCQHRGAPVVRDERGSARTLRCQYHSWTYDIDDGSLISVPDERDFVGLDKAQRCLPRVRCEVWDGWVFVNRNLDAPPLLDYLDPIPWEMTQCQGASLVAMRKKSELIPCNWKVTAEAFMEVYHFRHIHSRSDGDSHLDSRGAVMGLLPNGHSRMVTPFTTRSCNVLGMDDWSDWQLHDKPGWPLVETMNEMIRSTNVAYSMFPNLISPLGAHGFPFLVFWPVEKEMTRLDWIHFGVKDWDGDELPERWDTELARFDAIMEEDTLNMEPINRSLQSPAFNGVPINYQERRIWHFHEYIDRMIGLERVPEDLRVEQLLDPYVEP